MYIWLHFVIIAVGMPVYGGVLVPTPVVELKSGYMTYGLVIGVFHFDKRQNFVFQYNHLRVMMHL